MSDRNDIPEFETDDLKFMIVNIIRTIGLLPLDALETLVKETREAQRRFESFGWVTDPTRYRDMQQGGGMDQAKMELEIMEHILAIRKLGDAHDDNVRAQIARRGNGGG